MEFEITTVVLLLSFAVAVIMGAVANKTNFCTMGAVSDWVNMGDTGRLGAWMLSIAIAIAGVLLLQFIYDIPLDSTLPPYLTSNFGWLRYILGGFLFGIGMTLASGCGNKTMVNIGGGNMKSLVVLIVAGVFAYLMTKTSFYEVLFHSWVSATTIDLTAFDMNGQSLDAVFLRIFGSSNTELFHWLIGLLLMACFFFIAFRSKDLKSSPHNIVGGVVIGLAIVAGWYITGGTLGQEAIETVAWLDERPVGVGVQSYTFINPMGESITYLMDPMNTLLITFGVVAILGVITGSFVASILSKRFKIVWFYDRSDMVKHVFGAALMGIGGVLGMGCTIGQGITGVSTLSVGSLLVLGSIIFGSALTMKIIYYRMVYEEAGFIESLITSLVDLKLLTEKLRKLEKL